MSDKTIFKPENKKKISDFCLNVSAVVIMNCVLQFLCYPLFERELGEELNGKVLTLLSVVSITASALGVSLSYSRLVNEKKHHPSNGDYNVFLSAGSLICCVVGIIFLKIYDSLNAFNAVFFSLLLILTTIRTYSDVEYKLQTNFVKFFLFYLTLSIGYAVGILLFVKTKNWYIAMLTGEASAMLFSLFTTSLYRKNLKPSPALKTVLVSVGLLLPSTLIENVALNADRIILLAFADGTSVTYYYVASLFGKVVALLTVPINSVLISYLVKFDGGLTKKLWSVFTICALALGALATLACIAGSYIVLPLLYDFFDLVKPILLPALISQVAYFVSSVLMVVLLRFYGEKKQFMLNALYAIVFFTTTIISVKFYGLEGFTYASLAVNVFKLLAVTVFGLIASKTKKVIRPE